MNDFIGIKIIFEPERHLNFLDLIEELTLDEYITLLKSEKVQTDKTYRIIKLQKGEI